jgi:hypothetical protein
MWRFIQEEKAEGKKIAKAESKGRRLRQKAKR